MADPSRVPFLRPEYDQRLLQTSQEAIQRSRELLESTRPLVERSGGGTTAMRPVSDVQQPSGQIDAEGSNPAEPDGST